MGKMLTKEFVVELARDIARTLRPVIEKVGCSATVTPKMRSYDMDVVIRLSFPNEDNVVPDEYADCFREMLRKGQLPKFKETDLGKEFVTDDNVRYVLRGARKKTKKCIVLMRVMSRQLQGVTAEEAGKLLRR